VKLGNSMQAINIVELRDATEIKRFRALTGSSANSPGSRRPGGEVRRRGDTRRCAVKAYYDRTRRST
jgi:hypothetical protein